MKRLFCSLMAFMFSLISAPAAVHAQQEPVPVIFSQEELDQLLAPIALYPDALLTQVLMAATYPLETVQAARFAQRNPGLKGEALARALEAQPWDQSVKALVEFPDVLAMMDDQLAWTQKLGDAFLAQPDALMDTVQLLRAKAQSEGFLQSNRHQTVVVRDRAIIIEPATPEVIYVPYYNPIVVYGGWWWPAHPPLVWVPAHRDRSYGDLIVAGIAFGIGVAIINSNFHSSRPNWRDRNIVLHDRKRPRGAGIVWNHNSAHRLGAAYRDVPARNRLRHFDPGQNGNRGKDRGHGPKQPPQPLPHGRPWAGQPNLDAPARAVLRPEYRPAPRAGSHGRLVSGVENRLAPRSGGAPERERVHPFNPAGPAAAVQPQAERGRAIRGMSGFNRSVTDPVATPGRDHKAAPGALTERAPLR